MVRRDIKLVERVYEGLSERVVRKVLGYVEVLRSLTPDWIPVYVIGRGSGFTTTS